MAAIQLERQAFEKGSQLWITYSPFKALIHEGRAHRREYIAALWISKVFGTIVCSDHVVARSPWCPHTYAMGNLCTV